MTAPHRSFSLCLVAALTFPATAALTQEGSYDVDCAVALCTADGFPDDPLCSQA